MFLHMSDYDKVVKWTTHVWISGLGRGGECGLKDYCTFCLVTTMIALALKYGIGHNSVCSLPRSTCWISYLIPTIGIWFRFVTGLVPSQEVDANRKQIS
jgi:hypothetical protein